MASPTQWTWVWTSYRSWWWTGEAWHAAIHGVTKSWTWLSDLSTEELMLFLESLLDCKKIKLVNPKGNQSWLFIGRTDDETEAPILWPPDVKNWFLRKDPNVGKDWRHEKGMAQDEMVGWHHQLSGLEFEQTPGDSEDREAVLLPSTQSQRVRHDLATEQQQRYACLCVCV